MRAQEGRVCVRVHPGRVRRASWARAQEGSAFDPRKALPPTATSRLLAGSISRSIARCTRSVSWASSTKTRSNDRKGSSHRIGRYCMSA